MLQDCSYLIDRGLSNARVSRHDLDGFRGYFDFSEEELIDMRLWVQRGRVSASFGC